MKYIALIYANPDLEPAYGTPEFDAMMKGYAAASETYEKDGVLVGGHALAEPDAATSIRIRDGQVETMDGPFAETKERLGGYYIWECDNLDQALKYAALIPSAEHGTVEVRPLIDN